jgi:hypothetical protein
LAVLVVIGLTACADSSDGSSARNASSDEAPADEQGGSEASAGTADAADPNIDRAGEVQAGGQVAAESNASTTPGLGAPLDLDGLGRAIAVEAGVVIGTPNIRQAVDDTLTVVQRNNASVFSADVNIGDARDDGSIDGTGRIVVKVPPIDLYPLIADLEDTAGTLVGRTQNSEDVTEQLVDLDIRIGVEKSTIAGFETLLAQATEFDKIVEIQQTITEHTITLEQLLASQRNVDRRVELSTLTIDLTYVAPVPVTDEPTDRSDDGIADAFRSGWDAFAGALFAIGLVVAVAAPFLTLLLVVAGVVWLAGRRFRARTNQTGTHGRHDVTAINHPAPIHEPAPAPVSESSLVGPAGSAAPDHAEPNRAE